MPLEALLIPDSLTDSDSDGIDGGTGCNYIPFSRKNNKYLSHSVDNIVFGISESDYPRITVETTFLLNFTICLLFSRKQQQKLIIYCWQYHIQNQRTWLPQDNSWNHVSTKFYNLFTF